MPMTNAVRQTNRTNTGQLHSRRLLHDTYKLFMVSVLLQASSLTLVTAFYSIYAQYGRANDVIRMIGQCPLTCCLCVCVAISH